MEPEGYRVDAPHQLKYPCYCPVSTRGVAYVWEGAARRSTQLHRGCWAAESLNLVKMKLCPGCHNPFASGKLYKLFAVYFLHLDDGWFGTLGIQSAEM